ncbi:MAG: hypothetical protein KDA41_09130, partial [Planctomycetales bacterium]|nr:hypothetical protein [Planctomycetales bacterium]
MPDDKNHEIDESSDILDFEAEEVLDVNEALGNASSVSAIEGVTPLDFLDDVEHSDRPSSSSPHIDATINMPAQAGENDDLFDVVEEAIFADDEPAGPEAEAIDVVEPLDEAPLAAPFAEEPAAEAVDDLDLAEELDADQADEF